MKRLAFAFYSESALSVVFAPFMSSDIKALASHSKSIYLQTYLRPRPYFLLFICNHHNFVPRFINGKLSYYVSFGVLGGIKQPMKSSEQSSNFCCIVMSIT